MACGFGSDIDGNWEADRVEAVAGVSEGAGGCPAGTAGAGGQASHLRE
jgi:hypothetical protein